MASTSRVALLKFELQMTEQARKFGQRVRERRLELEALDPGNWEQKHVVERLSAAGDSAINTNQLSRYESGNGPFPREARQQAFATALETTPEDLRAGPLKERTRVPQPAPGAGPLDAAIAKANGANGLVGAVSELTAKIVALETTLTGELALVRKALAAQQKQLERVGRNPAAKKK